MPGAGKQGCLINDPMYEEGFGVLGASFMNIRDHSNRKCDRKGKNMKEKIAILWLFLSSRGCNMAPGHQKHEYLFAPVIWSDFEQFRMSRSIVC